MHVPLRYMLTVNAGNAACTDAHRHLILQCNYDELTRSRTESDPKTNSRKCVTSRPTIRCTCVVLGN